MLQYRGDFYLINSNNQPRLILNLPEYYTIKDFVPQSKNDVITNKEINLFFYDEQKLKSLKRMKFGSLVEISDPNVIENFLSTSKGEVFAASRIN
jgi:hypothetical protein